MNGHVLLAVKDTKKSYKFLTVRGGKLSFSEDQSIDSNNCWNNLSKYTEFEFDNSNHLVNHVTGEGIFCEKDKRNFKKLCEAKDARKVKFV